MMCLNLVRATRSQGTGLLLRIRGVLDSETHETNRHCAYMCYVFINHTRSSLTKPSSSRNFDISIITHTYVIYLQHLYYSNFVSCISHMPHSGGIAVKSARTLVVQNGFSPTQYLVTQRLTCTLNKSGAGSTCALKCGSLSLTRTQ